MQNARGRLVDLSDSSEDELDKYISSIFEDDDLTAVHKTATKYLNYTNDYVPRWGPSEAFRETYQNCYADGILRSHHISLSEFTTEYTETERLVLIQAYRPGTKQLLGFIRFAYDRDGYSTGGGLKIANFVASLQSYTLRTGGTTKVGDDEQTGQFGEGMKLSALVFRRQGYKFHIESTCFKWDFIYQKAELACKLSRTPAHKLEPMIKNTQGRPRTTEAHPWEDVCVVIGAPGKTRNIHGLPRKGDRIKIEDFKTWLNVTLDINPPKKIIHTSQGDLIRDLNYQGRLYLKGLSFSRGGTSSMPYQYGYNFATGKTTRDRTSLFNANEESRRVSDIWAAAILRDTSGDSDILAEYTQLLLKKLNKAGDVMLSRDRNTLREEVAEQVWAHMLTINPDKDGRKAFYYVENGKEDVKVINESLNLNPVAISKELWDMLRNFGLSRTPQDELLERFKIAKAICIPATSFAIHIDWMLRGVLQASAATKSMQLQFVDGRHLDVNVGLFADTWRVHDKWLSWEGAHQHSLCDTESAEEAQTFTCDHAILKLWDMMMLQLVASEEHHEIAAQEGNLRDLARVRLSQTPRSIECAQTDRKGELWVRWESADSHQNRDTLVKIVLHHTACDQLRLNEESTCACPALKSKAVSEGVTFKDLDDSLSYIPAASRDVEGVIIALPPQAVSPRTEDIAKAQGLDTTREVADTPSASITAQNTDSHDDDDENMVDAGPVFGDSSRDSSPGVTTQHNDRPEHSPGPQPAPTAHVRSAPGLIRQDSGNQLPPPAANSAKSAYNICLHELDTLGDKVDAEHLLQNGGFPDNHDFFRVRHTKGHVLYVVKRRQKSTEGSSKRPTGDDLTTRASKTPRLRSPSPAIPNTDEDATPRSPIHRVNNEAPSHPAREISVTDSLYNDYSSANPARGPPVRRSCSTCIRLNKGRLMFGRYSRGHFVPGHDQCVICSARKHQGGEGQPTEAAVNLGSADDGNYERPTARTVSPSPSEDGPITYRY